MRALVPALLLVLAGLVAGAGGMKWFAPVPAAPSTHAGADNDEALAALRSDNRMLRTQMAALTAEVAALRASLQERAAATVVVPVTPAPLEATDPLSAKPAKEALERYRAATGNQKPPAPADLVPFFSDPQEADKYLRNREAGAAAKPDRQQVRTEVKNELKQRLKAGSGETPIP